MRLTFKEMKIKGGILHQARRNGFVVQYLTTNENLLVSYEVIPEKRIICFRDVEEMANLMNYLEIQFAKKEVGQKVKSLIDYNQEIFNKTLRNMKIEGRRVSMKPVYINSNSELEAFKRALEQQKNKKG